VRFYVTSEKIDAPRRVSDMIQARGVEYERAIEARREHNRQRDRRRKREARQRQTSDQHEQERARKREARTLLTPEQREREREQRRSRKKLRPFMAVDGEGGGTDKLGRQNYLLMGRTSPPTSRRAFIDPRLPRIPVVPPR
jgi:hypothetical protein